MKILSAAIAIAVAISSAHAIDAPARYAHPYKGKLAIRYVSEADALAKCERLFNSPSFACALPSQDGSSCEIWMVRAGEYVTWQGKRWLVNAQFLNGVLPHEEAHCNGWPRNHPK